MNTLENIIRQKNISVGVYSKELQTIFLHIGKNDPVKCLIKDCTVMVTDGESSKNRLGIVAVTEEELVVGCNDCNFVVNAGEHAQVSSRSVSGGKYYELSISTVTAGVSMIVGARDWRSLSKAVDELELLTIAGDTVFYREEALSEAAEKTGTTTLYGESYQINDEEIKRMVEDVDNLSNAMFACKDLYDTNSNEKNLDAFKRFYVPATKQLIDRYSDLCERIEKTKEKTADFDMFEKTVKNTMSKVRDNFSAMYNNMFTPEALDIDDDLEELKRNFIADGLLDDDTEVKEQFDITAPSPSIPFEIVVVSDGDNE